MYGILFHQRILFLIILLHLQSSQTNALHFGEIYNKTLNYLVIIKNDYEHGFTLCSGALVALRWVLTNTPCLYSLRGPVLIYIKSMSVYQPTQITTIRRTVIQENFNELEGVGSLALIEIVSRARLKPGEKPISITDKEVDWYYNEGGGCNFKAFGYKRALKESVVSYGVLTWGKVEKVKSARNKAPCGCLDLKKLPDKLKKEILCTNEGKFGRICIGDFGAPLVCFNTKEDYETDNNPILVGVAHNFMACDSYSIGDDFMQDKVLPCSDLKVTDIYTDVFVYRSWILKTIARYKLTRHHHDIGYKRSKARPPPKFKMSFLVMFLYYTCFFILYL